MGPGYLLDTNICLYLLNKTLTPEGFTFVGSVIDQGHSRLSVVTQIELLGFAFPSEEEESITGQFVSAMSIVALTEPIIHQTIAIRRQHKIKLPDAIIAATALVHGFTLVTRNMSDFVSIDDLVVVDPFML